MTILDFFARKQSGQKISMVTCYDYSFASIVNQTSIDTILIGDSAAMVMHGFDTTIPATMEMMVLHTSAVRKGAPDKFIVADMPFLTTRKGSAYAAECAGKLIAAGANCVKIERVSTQPEIIKHLVDSGIPVMAHLGLTPQFYNTLGGHKRQGKTQEQAADLEEEALLAQSLGCFSVLMECIPDELAERITKKLDVATIGIGSGSGTDGQVLVLHDILGLTEKSPKFAKRYLDGYNLVKDAFEQFHTDVSKN